MLNQTNHYHLQVCNELTSIRFQLLKRLHTSSETAHHTVLALIRDAEPALWIELLANKVGPEYQPLIARLNTLEAALSQIEIGQYGYCCDCEEKIDEQTLNLDPAAQRCQCCQR